MSVINNLEGLKEAHEAKTPFTLEEGGREWTPSKRGQTVLGFWYKATNSSSAYWCTFINGKFEHFPSNKGECYSDPFDMLWAWAREHFSCRDATGYVKGEQNSELKKAGFESVIKSVIEDSEALNDWEFPQVDLKKEVVKGYDYSRYGRRTEHDSVVIGVNGFEVEHYFTVEIPAIVSRNLLEEYSAKVIKDSEGIEKIARLLKTVVPKTDLEKANFREQISRQITKDWWKALKTKGRISKNDVWVRLLKRLKGL